MTEARRPFFAANWKMHMGPVETGGFLRVFASEYQARDDRSVVFFPPSISIASFREATSERRDLEVGIQDVHSETHGAHTGAISAGLAAEAGVGWGLAGHSERRREFGDDDDLVGLKLARLLEAGLQPIFCVGETLKEREEDRLYEVLSRQVATGLRDLDGDQRRRLTYAYEPVWAIGTGQTATPADAGEAHEIVRRRIAHLTDEATGDEAIILYGGSVNPGNIEDLLAVDGVDGVLVGGASLDPGGFARICSAGRG
jgi:triosephosphate isomerase